MTYAEINNAVRSLAYLKTPDRVKAGIRNTYGYTVPVERVARILSVIQSEGTHRAKVAEPKESDAWDYDVRVQPNVRPIIVDPVNVPAKPRFHDRAPLPKTLPAITRNPYTGPFEFKRLVASVAADFGITLKDVIGKGRARRFLLARLVVTKLCIEQGMSCANIGRRMGDRDHSTILHQRDVFEHYAKMYSIVQDSYERHVELRREAKGGAK